MTTPLHLTVAKLELKQLEMLDKISRKQGEYTIRLIASTITDKFVTVNGDWFKITGRDEDCCIDGSWDSIVPNNEISNVIKFVDEIKSGKQTNNFKCKIKGKGNSLIDVNWKGKYFPEINGIIFIGTIKK